MHNLSHDDFLNAHFVVSALLETAFRHGDVACGAASQFCLWNKANSSQQRVHAVRHDGLQLKEVCLSIGACFG